MENSLIMDEEGFAWTNDDDLLSVFEWLEKDGQGSIPSTNNKRNYSHSTNKCTLAPTATPPPLTTTTATTTTATPIWKKTKQQLRDEREAEMRRNNVKEIMQMALDLQACLNTGDYNSLAELIDRYFATDCEFQSSYMKKSMFGNEYLLRMYQTIMDAAPDSHGVLRCAHFDNKLGALKLKTWVTGTVCFDYSLQEHPHMDPSINLSEDNVDYEWRLKAIELRRTGKRMVMTGELDTTMFLDASLEKVQKIVSLKKLVFVNEAPPI